MQVDRRNFLVLGAVAMAGCAPARAAAPAMSAFGLDAAQYGLRPGSSDDQSAAFQRAIGEATRAGAPLAIAPGDYRVGGLRLPTGAQLMGVRGATKLVLTTGQSLIEADRADNVTLSGLVLDGGKRPLPMGRGLVQIGNARALRITDCEVLNAGGNAIQLFATEGQIAGTLVADAADVAIHSLDATGLLIARNTIRGAGNNGIQIWRSDSGDDGSIVTDNRIENIANRSGGSGQYGNAINVFRSGNVIVRGNRIGNCAFSAVRGNAASNIHIEGNAVTDAREVALYAEFGFQGAMIANNVLDGTAIGVSVTNFNNGGRLAVVQGNLIRNLYPKRPAGTDPLDAAGIGISVEADCAVTGNLVESAPTAGLSLGFGRYLRDVTATGNILRKCGIGIAVSVASGAGPALISNNLISEAAHGAIVGMDRRNVVTGDLMKEDAGRYLLLTIFGNRAS
jgi:uncharacterized secreted repeat protein (TIGR03808 family)